MPGQPVKFASISISDVRLVRDRKGKQRMLPLTPKELVQVALVLIVWDSLQLEAIACSLQSKSVSKTKRLTANCSRALCLCIVAR